MTGSRASLRISLNSLRAHKRRFAGTFTAVLLGVAFLAGTLVMGDTLRGSFDTMFASANGRHRRRRPQLQRRHRLRREPGHPAERSHGPGRPYRRDPRRRRRRARTSRARDSSSEPTASRSAVRARPPSPATGSTTPSSTRTGSPTAAPPRSPARSSSTAAPPTRAACGSVTATVLRTPDPVQVTVVGLATFGGEDGMAQVTFTGMTRADAEKYLTPEPGRGGDPSRCGPDPAPASRSSWTR